MHPPQKGIDPSALVAVMYSDQWRAHITNEDKIYFVNTQSQGNNGYLKWIFKGVLSPLIWNRREEYLPLLAI